MKQYYVSFPDQSWHEGGYLTAGKKYALDFIEGEDGYVIANDIGSTSYIRLAGCPHLNRHPWTLHEVDEPGYAVRGTTIEVPKEQADEVVGALYGTALSSQQRAAVHRFIRTKSESAYLAMCKAFGEKP